MIKTITGDLLEAEDKYIVHQINCVSHYASGIAAAIFHKYPHANVYVSRMQIDQPGDIIIRGNGQDERYVVGLLGQYFPGSFSDKEIDTESQRQKYFHRSLIKLAKISNLESVAFPYHIGCGIGGGNWNWYLGTLNNFAKYVSDTQGAKTTIYQRKEDI